jgi:hypothetical protein
MGVAIIKEDTGCSYMITAVKLKARDLRPKIHAQKI